jgi:hypothetical protein
MTRGGGFFAFPKGFCFSRQISYLRFMPIAAAIANASPASALPSEGRLAAPARRQRTGSPPVLGG